MSALDIIPIPGHPGMYARRAAVEMWQRAGSPPIAEAGAGRLYDTQKWLYDQWQAGVPGYNPADNPDQPGKYPLAHVRFVALDFATRAGAQAARAAGFEFPYPYEWWHGQLPNVYAYPLVKSIPTTASDGAKPFAPPVPEETDMSYSIVPLTDGGIYLQSLISGRRAHVGSPYHVSLLQRAKKNDSNDTMLPGELDIVSGYLTAVNPPTGATVDTDALAARLAQLDDATDAAVVRQAVKDAIAETVKKLA